MVEHVYDATSAVVTLDVGIPSIVWGWIITMNMWAKSIATGVIFVGFYLLKKYPKQGSSLKISLPIIALVFIHITLLFTVLDLHQMFRFWHIFTNPHFTSAITVGAWAVTGFVGVLFLMAFASIIKKDDALFNKGLTLALILAIPSTLYTAAIMGESTARELWQAPTEMAQMILAATLAGSATLLLISAKFSDEMKKDLAIILGMSAFLSFTLYLGEYIFGPMKAEEVGATLAFIQSGGSWSAFFWSAMALAFIMPMVITFFSVKNKTTSMLYLAGVLALAGLWMSKHVWLIIPQLLPLS